MAKSRLSDFIRAHGEAILAEWVEFAQALPIAGPLDLVALRDHAHGMLQAIAADLESAQSAAEQVEKSCGHAPRSPLVSEAEQHGAARVLAGFGINDELAEFRALRAGVLRLWTELDKNGPAEASGDLIRFNEAIDQALAESVARYSFDRGRYERLFDALLSSSSDLSFIFDPDGRVIYANQAMARLYRVGLGAIIGKNLSELGVPDELRARLRQVIDSGQACRGEGACAPGDDGARRVHEYRLVPAFDQQGRLEAVTGLAQDITERKQEEEAIRRRAHYDSLTGLPNRVLFRDRLERDVRRATRSGLPLALVFIDLDGFKDVNDRLGHDAGDCLLRQAAQRIGACVRGIDTVARLGGDEFTVILSELHQMAHVDLLASKILDELARPFPVRGQDVRISGSIGITFFPQDAANLDDLLRNADQAMYVAKNAGRNRFSFFTIGMREAARARQKVIDELRRALPLGQLSLYYQPIVELASARIVKAEALLRWRHPLAGLMLPAEFLGLAEETGLIGAIGEWVFEQALRSARAWSALLGAPFQISVNQSPAEFLSRAPARSLDALAMAPASLSVEVAERVLLDPAPGVTARLDILRAAGVELAIDRYGTGYSSLAYLKKFDVDYLKIDQSFVRDGADSRAIAETTIVMAHRLGLKVIAEGVETAAQRDWLKAAQCDFAQGFFFSAPLAAPDFERLLGRPVGR